MPPFPQLESDDPDSLAAAEVAGQLPPEQRLERVLLLSQDPVLAVRMVAAEQLARLMPPAAGMRESETPDLPGRQAPWRSGRSWRVHWTPSSTNTFACSHSTSTCRRCSPS